MKTISLISRGALVVALLSGGTAALAQSAPPDAATATAAAASAEIIVTGTRTTGITAAESATPIKLLSADALSHVGQPNLNQALTQLVPSFVAEAFGGDTANLTLSARLRGLSPNHALVLVNGKRRHPTANLHVLGGPYQGAATADLDLISPLSIKRIEVLEQGAAAQYGSDAIAGVINIILKTDAEGGSANASFGQYYKNDGDTYSGQVNLGTKIGDAGYLNVTGFYRQHGFSQRGGLDRRIVDPNGALYSFFSATDSAAVTAAKAALYPGATGFPNVNKIVGDAQSKLSNVGFSAGYDFGGVEAYAFGTFSHRTASAYENFRLPDAVKASPVLGVTGNDVTPGEIFFNRNGFNPREGLRENDWGITGGLKGDMSGFHWDLSATYGRDKDKIFTYDSANSTLFVNTHTTPTTFYDGYFLANELTLNLDVSKDFDLGMAKPLNVAAGAEYRDNKYAIGRGDPASIYFEGGQSYPGFQPSDAGLHSRHNESLYIDVAATPVDALKVDIAGRYEHYSDFGSKAIFKVTGRYDFTDGFALRGTVSTGFRAPTLAESFYSATNVAPTSATVQLPANSSSAALLGFQSLRPEKSTTFSAGVVARPVSRLTITLDAYQVSVRDRVIGSGSVIGKTSGNVVNQAVLNAIAAHGNILDPAVGDVSVSVFTNGVNTRTRGIDLTASYPVPVSFGLINLTLTGNYNKTKITKVTIAPALLDQTATSILTNASPRWKVIAGGVFTHGPISITLRESFYGKASEDVRPSGDYNFVTVKTKTAGVTDLEVSYDITKGINFAIGANNLFNRKGSIVPNELPRAGTSSALAPLGGLRPATGTNVWNSPLTFSPYGINGGYYYARATVKF